MAGFAPGVSTHADMFLKIDGIEGESLDHAHKGEIQITSFAVGGVQPATSDYGGGAGSGKVQLQDFHFTKYHDKASPKLFEAMCTGKHTPKVILSCRKAGGTQQEFLKWTFSEVLITSVQFSGSGGESLPSDSVTISFVKIEHEYKPQDEKGGLGGVVKAGWDRAKNQKV